MQTPEQTGKMALGRVAAIIILLVCVFVGIASLLPLDTRGSQKQPEPFICPPAVSASASAVADTSSQPATPAAPTVVPAATTTTAAASAPPESTAAPTKPPSSAPPIVPFVDPWPGDPAVNGTTPPLKMGDRRNLQNKMLCEYHLSGAQIDEMMASDPTAIAPVPVIRNRYEMPNALQCEGKRGAGVELGVQAGLLSDHMLRYWKSCSEYWLVDLWKQQKNYVDDANVADDKQENLFQETLKRLQPFHEKVKVCRNFTTECAKRFPDNYFDFIYVDARHDRKGVVEDLEAWWPKLKRGGIMSGHDYVTLNELPLSQDWTVNGDGSRDQTGLCVKGAVDSFFMSIAAYKAGHMRQVSVTTNELNTMLTWQVRK